jgi:putative glutathione S-transferase
MLWDTAAETLASNSSADIILAFDKVSPDIDLRPDGLACEVDALTSEIFDGLSNAV